MTDAWQLSPYRTPSRAEELADYQDDLQTAARDAALLALRAELVAVQAKVLAAHRRVANLIDAVQAMETAIADVDFEMERE